MKFTKTHTDWNGQFLETVSIQIKEDAHIDDALEAFGRFLKAAGYHFDGEIQIVGEEETDPLDDDQDWNDDDEDEETVDENEMTPEFEGPIEGFNDSIQLDDLSTDLPKEWPFPTKSRP